MIRDATPDDLHAIQAIYAQEVLHGLATFEEVPPSVSDLRERWQRVRDGGLPWLVATADSATGGAGGAGGAGGQNSNVVGFSYATTYRARPAYRFTIEVSVYVATDHQRRGIGRALLHELIERCERGPWRQLIAVIGDSANAGSIATHQRLGFTPIGTIVGAGFKLGQWVDTVLMQRPLGAGDTTLPEHGER